ncbi:MAG: hypothetical protein ACLRIS_10945 [Flavonifractor plautii]
MRNTAQYILKRLLYMIPMVLVITFLIYGGLELTPGDAISHMIPPDQLANVNPEQLEALRSPTASTIPSSCATCAGWGTAPR